MIYLSEGNIALVLEEAPKFGVRIFVKIKDLIKWIVFQEFCHPLIRQTPTPIPVKLSDNRISHKVIILRSLLYYLEEIQNIHNRNRHNITSVRV